MRILHIPSPENGDIRTKTKYLLFPKRIGDETRWLEITSWEQRYQEYVSRLTNESMGGEWINMRWVALD